jgi:hypothetical protein
VEFKEEIKQLIIKDWKTSGENLVKSDGDILYFDKDTFLYVEDISLQFKNETDINNACFEVYSKDRNEYTFSFYFTMTNRTFIVEFFPWFQDEVAVKVINRSEYYEDFSESFKEELYKIIHNMEKYFLNYPKFKLRLITGELRYDSKAINRAIGYNV